MDPFTLTGSTAMSAGLQQQAAAQAAALQSSSNGDPKKARAAAQQFEGFFVSQMMDNMMEGVQPDEVFGGGFAEDTWRPMLNQEYGKEIAKSGRLGIADSVVSSMLKMQEQASAKAAADAQTGASGQAGAAAASTPTIATAAAAAAAYMVPASLTPATPPAKSN